MSDFQEVPGMFMVLATMVFLFGLIWGSFFNVCIYRVPVKKSVVRPGSHCYSCGTFLKWYDNIPLVSYLILRGNCRSCGTHFSARYFWAELASGVMFLAIFLKFGLVWALPFHIGFASLLFVGVFTDIDHFILPDGITIGGFVFAVGVTLILGRNALISGEYALARDTLYSFRENGRTSPSIPLFMPVLWSLCSAAFGWALLAGVGAFGRILFRKEAMGGGDVKLFAFLGAYLGAINCIWILFLSAILGTIVGLTLILVHKLVGKDEYEEIVLDPSRAKTTSPLAAETQLPPEESQHEPIKFRIARKTSRQLHHFPFGPYIAVAALVILLTHDKVNRLTREALFLPPEHAATSSTSVIRGGLF